MNKSITIFVGMVLLLTLSLCSLSTCSLNRNTVQFSLGKYSLGIPEKYSQEQAMPMWLALLPGLDNSTNDLMFIIPADEVKVKDYKQTDGKYKENIHGLLAVLSPEDKERYLSGKKFEDLWYAEGSYSKRLIEPYKNNLFKVFRKIEYPNSWALVSHNPESGKTLPEKASEFWLAHCLSGTSPITSSGNHVGCDSYIVVDDLLIEFNVSEQNLSKLDDIKNFLVSEVKSWIINTNSSNK